MNRNTFDYDIDEEDLADGEGQYSALPTLDLFSTEVFPSASEALTHAADLHGFDVKAFCASRGLDMYQRIKLVNFVRKAAAKKLEEAQSTVLEKHQVAEIVAALFTAWATKGKDCEWCGEAYLKPTLENDPLLCELDEEDSDDEEENEVETTALKAENAALRLQLENVQAMLRRVVLEQEAASASASSASSQEKKGPADAYYIDSYSHFDIHEEMLRDRVRTQTYKDAMIKNASILKGKRVLDVGCGTGILSMFAATAGASAVVGVDMSAIIEKAREIVKANGLDSHIKLVRGRLEEIESLPGIEGNKVDVIVSEWMGYALLYESMLDSVLDARDKYLADGGIMMPSSATIFAQALSDVEGHKDKFEFFSDVYGYDMSSVVSVPVREPGVYHVNANHVCSDKAVLKHIDIATVTKPELDFRSAFALKMKSGTVVTGVVLSFDTAFDGPSSDWVRANLETGCEVETTHWKQTVLWLRQPFRCADDGVMNGFLSYARNDKNPRYIDLVLEIEGGNTELYMMQ